MTWGNIIVTHNTAEGANTLYHAENVLTKEAVTRDAGGSYRIHP
jgi:hypothetical protein